MLLDLNTTDSLIFSMTAKPRGRKGPLPPTLIMTSIPMDYPLSEKPDIIKRLIPTTLRPTHEQSGFYTAFRPNILYHRLPGHCLSPSRLTPLTMSQASSITQFEDIIRHGQINASQTANLYHDRHRRLDNDLAAGGFSRWREHGSL